MGRAVGRRTGTSTNAAGIAIDAEGVLRTKIFSDPGGQVMRERIASAKATLDPKVTAFSKLRKVSLNRLEQAILDHQGTLSDEMRYLAGLQRVRYVFYYPDSKDIVLAGPAEGWVPDLSGRIVGITSGRPVVQLQDVVVALRAFPSGGSTTPADRLLDRSDPGGPGRDAAVPAEQPSRTPTSRSRSSKPCATASAISLSASTAFRRRRVSPRSWSRPTTA